VETTNARCQIEDSKIPILAYFNFKKNQANFHLNFVPGPDDSNKNTVDLTYLWRQSKKIPTQNYSFVLKSK